MSCRCGGLSRATPQLGRAARELNVRREDCVAGYLTGSSPEGVSVIREGWPAEWKSPTLLDDVLDFPVKIDLEKPNHAGIDRILNAVACNRIRPTGTPAVIVDTGTATTVDSISPEGAFEGGSILPGFELCARAVHQYTALLPFVTIDELSNESHEPLGTSTREALRSGLLWGQIGAIRELVRLLERTVVGCPVGPTHGRRRRSRHRRCPRLVGSPVSRCRAWRSSSGIGRKSGSEPASIGRLKQRDGSRSGTDCRALDAAWSRRRGHDSSARRHPELGHGNGLAVPSREPATAQRSDVRPGDFRALGSRFRRRGRCLPRRRPNARDPLPRGRGGRRADLGRLHAGRLPHRDLDRNDASHRGSAGSRVG